MKFNHSAELPITALRNEIRAAILSSPVVIISGQTGSGKTTQIPQIALEMGRGSNGRQIALTQPRRLAARSVAERIAQETHTTLGEEIGYQVRFTDHSSPQTRLRVVTDGIILAQIRQDPLLKKYDTLIIDEAHERSLNIDFLLGYLSSLLPKRPDLKVIITSATIDSQKFQQHFEQITHSPVPVIEVSGRTYPVDIYYETPDDPPVLSHALPSSSVGDSSFPYTPKELAADPSLHVARAVKELIDYSHHQEGSRDILVFASGERSIKDYESAIKSILSHSSSHTPQSSSSEHIEIIPLHARLSAQEQHAIFDSHTTQRIIIATNIAETSLTVPGIRYVVDPGMARISRYSKASQVQRLPIEEISQASANQRAGRTGRLTHGIAIRLYSEENFHSRPAFTDPEILRTDLASVLLQMLSIGVVHTVEDIHHFDFIDAPPFAAIKHGISQLQELGALTRHKDTLQLTSLGKKLAQLPVDVRLARMILEASHYGGETLSEILVIVAFLSIQDPRERPEDHHEEAARLHQRFFDKTSDYLTILNLWEYLFGLTRATSEDPQNTASTTRKQMSSSALRRLCNREYLHFLRIRQWKDLYQQLHELCCKDLHFAVKDPRPRFPISSSHEEIELGQQKTSSLTAVWDSDNIHRSMLSGMLSHVGMQVIIPPKASDTAKLRGAAKARALRQAQKRGRNNYRGVRGSRFSIFSTSSVVSLPPEWIMAATLLETSRLWAQSCAAINPLWIEDFAGDLIKVTYSHPHWSPTKGAVLAEAKKLFYGLPLSEHESILWSHINPQEAREIFIREGLVNDNMKTRCAYDDFIKANKEKITTVQEHSIRSRNINFSGEEDLYAFYDKIIPLSVTDSADFEKWWKKEHDLNPHLLDYEPLPPSETFAEDFPSQLYVRTVDGEDIALTVTYTYSPQKSDDGATVHIPLDYLSRLTPLEFTWFIPGLRQELILALIKILPKNLRIQFVPAPQSAQKIYQWIHEHEEDYLSPTGEHTVSFIEVFAQAAVHLLHVDIHPELLKDNLLNKLPSYLRFNFVVENTENSSSKKRSSLHKNILAHSYSLSSLQKELHSKAHRAAHLSVQTKVKEAQQKGHTITSFTLLHQTGMTTDSFQCILWQKLVEMLRLPVERITTRWSTQQTLLLATSPYPSVAQLVEDLHYVAIRSLSPDIGSIQTDKELEKYYIEIKDRLEDEIYKFAQITARIMESYKDLEKTLSQHASLQLLSTIQDIRTHVQSLVKNGFLKEFPPLEIESFCRYIAGDKERLIKAKTNMSRDTNWSWDVKEAQDIVNHIAAIAQKNNTSSFRDQLYELSEQAQWMSEEFRLSLWAQNLGVELHPSIHRLKGLLHKAQQISK